MKAQNCEENFLLSVTLTKYNINFILKKERFVDYLQLLLIILLSFSCMCRNNHKKAELEQKYVYFN